jgi:uncharacterized membrane protein YkgB
MKPIFRTGVVVLVLAIPEFLFLAVWLCVRQWAANIGVWASLLAVGMCLSTLRLILRKPTTSKRHRPDSRRSVKTQGYGGVIAKEHTRLIGPQTSHELQKLV